MRGAAAEITARPRSLCAAYIKTPVLPNGVVGATDAAQIESNEAPLPTLN